MHGEAASPGGWDGHASQEGMQLLLLDAVESSRRAQRGQAAHSCVCGGQVSELAHATPIATRWVLAAGQEGDHVLLADAGRQLSTQQGQGVGDPVANPGLAGVKGSKTGWQLPQAPMQVAHHAVTAQGESLGPLLGV
jgi:hypothetical protein